MATKQTVGDAVVSLSLDTTKYKKQLDAVSKNIFKYAIAPGLAAGLLGVRTFMKTTDPAAIQLNKSLFLLKDSFRQLMARVGEVVVKNFHLNEAMAKLSDRMNKLGPDGITKMINAWKTLALVFVNMRIVSGIISMGKWLKESSSSFTSLGVSLKHLFETVVASGIIFKQKSKAKRAMNYFLSGQILQEQRLASFDPELRATISERQLAKSRLQGAAIVDHYALKQAVLNERLKRGIKNIGVNVGTDVVKIGIWALAIGLLFAALGDGEDAFQRAGSAFNKLIKILNMVATVIVGIVDTMVQMLSLFYVAKQRIATLDFAGIKYDAMMFNANMIGIAGKVKRNIGEGIGEGVQPRSDFGYKGSESSGGFAGLNKMMQDFYSKNALQGSLSENSSTTLENTKALYLNTLALNRYNGHKGIKYYPSSKATNDMGVFAPSSSVSTGSGFNINYLANSSLSDSIGAAKGDARFQFDEEIGNYTPFQTRQY